MAVRCDVCSNLRREARKVPAGKTGWAERGACFGTDDQRIWPSERSSKQAKAEVSAFIREFCRDCGVKEECWDDAARQARGGQVYGVWGGVDWTKSTSESAAQWRRRVGVRPGLVTLEARQLEPEHPGRAQRRLAEIRDTGGWGLVRSYQSGKTAWQTAYRVTGRSNRPAMLPGRWRVRVEKDGQGWSVWAKEER